MYVCLNVLEMLTDRTLRSILTNRRDFQTQMRQQIHRQRKSPWQ